MDKHEIMRENKVVVQNGTGKVKKKTDHWDQTDRALGSRGWNDAGLKLNVRRKGEMGLLRWSHRKR